ncbi:MAG TPA: CHASE2 domain-containing protein [Usitatibacter sp.]|nr:CHASE2 domain-containing protein [Usitatibacter sp.]
MEAHDDGGRSAMRAIAVAAIALAGFLFSFTPVAERLDAALLDIEWRALRNFDTRPAPDDIVIVGIDEATVSAIPEPPGMWHLPLGRALARLAAAKPRAIGLEFPLPERSFDVVKPGLDRALFDGLAAAVENGPFVAVLNIDARTRSAKTIHTPYLALLGESRLGLGLTARDADGVTRRFSLLVPTEDGGFPTLEGRMCRALKRDCNDGLIHFALGRPFAYVPLKNLLTMDEELARRLFRDRIVLIGEAQPYVGRLEVPMNLAAWESEARSSPGIVVHAQTLRTALAALAPQQATRPLVLILLSLAALVYLVRDARMTAVTALLAALAALVVAVAALRGGVAVPVSPILATLLVAVAARALPGLGRRRSS